MADIPCEEFNVAKSTAQVRIEVFGPVDGDAAFDLGATFDSLVCDRKPVAVEIASPEVSLLGWAVLERAVGQFRRAGVPLHLEIEGDEEPLARRQAQAMLRALEASAADDGQRDGSR